MCASVKTMGDWLCSAGLEILGQETQLLELRLQVLVEQEDSELLHHAALLGNLPVIRDYLDKYPNEVPAPR